MKTKKQPLARVLLGRKLVLRGRFESVNLIPIYRFDDFVGQSVTVNLARPIRVLNNRVKEWKSLRFDCKRVTVDIPGDRPLRYKNLFLAGYSYVNGLPEGMTFQGDVAIKRPRRKSKEKK